MSEAAHRPSCRWDPEHAEWLATLVDEAGGEQAMAKALAETGHRSVAHYAPEGWASLLRLMLRGGESVALADVAVSHVIGTAVVLALPSGAGLVREVAA